MRRKSDWNEQKSKGMTKAMDDLGKLIGLTDMFAAGAMNIVLFTAANSMLQLNQPTYFRTGLFYDESLLSCWSRFVL